MTVLIEIERRDGKRSAVYFEDEKNAERVLQFARGDVKVKTATMRKLNIIQGAVSAEEAIELLTGIRVPAGTFTEGR
jgi:hypothetical protein